jgi:LysM repeat protein
MKNLFSMSPRCWISLASLLAALFAMPAGHGMAQGTRVFIDPPTREVAVDATTQVDVRIENVSSLYAFEVHLTFAPALLEVVDADPGTDGVQIQPGTFLSPDYVAQNVVNQADGKIDFAVTQMAPHEPVSGSGILVTVTFKGEAAGDSDITVGVLLSDRDGGPISAGTQGGRITVTTGPTWTHTPTSTPGPTPTYTPTPTPTPTSTPGPTLTYTPTPTSTPTSTPGPTPTHTPTPNPSATPSPPWSILGYHTVQPRETLYCIGRAYGVDPYAIATQNGILNPNIIHPGQRLAIPNVPRTLPPGRVCARQFNGGTPTFPTCRWYHTVAPGENLYRISLRYGVSMWAIAEANNILNLHYIRAGQVLCIP